MSAVLINTIETFLVFCYFGISIWDTAAGSYKERSVIAISSVVIFSCISVFRPFLTVVVPRNISSISSSVIAIIIYIRPTIIPSSC